MRWWLFLVIAGCDWSLHRMQEPVRCDMDGQCDVEPADGIVAMDSAAIAPPRLTRQLMLRGRERFERVCAACHGVAADGDSQVARTMTLRRPPSLVDANAARLTDDRIVAVITNGYGLMPAYRGLVASDDRYAILHYMRALQQRDVPLDQLSARWQAEARQWLP